MSDKICIIGCIDLKNNIFKDFTIRYLTLNEEEKIIRYWLQYLKRVIGNNIKIYHWSSAERVYIDYIKSQYPNLEYPNFTYVDTSCCATPLPTPTPLESPPPQPTPLELKWN